MKSTVKELKKYLKEELAGYFDKDELDQVVFLVTEHLTGMSRTEQVLRGEERPDKSVFDKSATIVERLKQHEPIQYVLGTTEFYGFPFYTMRGVLIPRRETEELADWVWKTLKNRSQPLSILDVGTGSGCIAVVLKKLLPFAQVMGWDYSEKILAVAEKNAELNSAHVTFEKRNILEVDIDQTFDVVVSNPPYVLESDKSKMASNVLDYEPEEALFVPDEEALRFYYAIAAFSLKHLNPGGYLFFEIHERKGKEIKEYLEKTGFKNVEVRKDMQGKPRMVRGEKK